METYALEQYFKKFLEEKALKQSTIKHYAVDAMGWISNYLLKKGLLHNSIYEVADIIRLYKFRDILLADAEYIELNKNGNNMYSAGYNHYIRFAEAIDLDTHTVCLENMDIPVLPGGYTIEQGAKKWKRSGLIREQILHYAEYKCEVEPLHKTFIAAATGRQYMEGHHLIAMKKQDVFSHGLDIYANIVCLCPLCHRRLHYATEEEKRPLLTKLYEDRKDRLANSGIKLSKEEFLVMTV